MVIRIQKDHAYEANDAWPIIIAGIMTFFICDKYSKWFYIYIFQTILLSPLSSWGLEAQISLVSHTRAQSCVVMEPRFESRQSPSICRLYSLSEVTDTQQRQLLVSSPDIVMNGHSRISVGAGSSYLNFQLHCLSLLWIIFLYYLNPLS